MSVFIGYTSAYDYWRTSDMPPGGVSRACPKPGTRAQAFPHEPNLAGLESLGRPRHVVVAHANDRARAVEPVCHVWTGAFPSGSFVKIREGVYLSSPGRSFAEMAEELSPVELIRYGYVLCSGYAYDESEAGFRERVPLASVQTLERFVGKAAKRNGAKKARRALRFIAARSASPMETNLAMMLCMPRMLGGYGLDLPELNARIEARAKGLVERDHFSCDLYWREQRVAVEYDSGLHHSGAEAEARDSARRSALQSNGISVVSITPEQFFDARKVDEAARAVAKLTGKRLPPNDASWMMRRYKLRKELLQDMRRMRAQ